MSLSPRKIGDALVPPVGFGAMGISAHYGSVDSDEDRLKVLDAAFHKGCTHWDTSNSYGDSELLIGKWFQQNPGKREKIFLATKFGNTPQGARNDPEYMREAFAKSLERLGTDYVDLYYIHRPDPNTPIEISVGAMAELVKEGKVKYIGLSECTPRDIRRAHAIHPISAIQVEFSPFVLDIKKNGVLTTARELCITVVVYSPLTRGLVTGRYKSPDDFEEGDFRKRVPKFSAENFPKILSVVNRLHEIGRRHSATAGQVTLAWILAQGEDFVVIPGTKKIKYLEENILAASVKLPFEEITAIQTLAQESEVPGDRYPAAYMQHVMKPTPELPK